MPEISVIMGACNGGPFLEAAVASVRAQTFTDWELVIVDNGSTDGALTALLAAHPDPKIRVFRFAAALGPGAALAVACREARGRYLAVLDADDLATSRRLEIQHAYLELRPDLCLLGGASDLIDEEGRILGREPFVGRHEDIHGFTAYVHTLRHSSIMFRRELLERVKYRSVLGNGTDRDFFSRAAETGRVEALPAVLCLYRVHAENFSHRNERGAASRGLVSMLASRRRRGLPEEIEKWEPRFAAILAASPTDEQAANLACARLFAGESLHELAAFHAWLAMRAGARWRGGARYLQAIVRGLGNARAARIGFLKAWLKEPVQQLLRAGGMPDRWQF